MSLMDRAGFLRLTALAPLAGFVPRRWRTVGDASLRMEHHVDWDHDWLRRYDAVERTGMCYLNPVPQGRWIRVPLPEGGWVRRVYCHPGICIPARWPVDSGGCWIWTDESVFAMTHAPDSEIPPWRGHMSLPCTGVTVRYDMDPPPRGSFSGAFQSSSGSSRHGR